MMVILDRDGTIVIDRHYLADPSGLEFLPGAAEGLALLHSQGHRLVLITNQSGIGRGLFSEAQLEAVHARLRQMLSAVGAPLAAIYYCPHAPEAGCECRKPRSALFWRAAAELGFEPSESVVIGDKDSDVAFGARVGARTILIAPGLGGTDSGPQQIASGPEQTALPGNRKPDYVAADLVQAASAIQSLLLQR